MWEDGGGNPASYPIARHGYPLASGWLKALHCALDDARTTRWEIAHDHTKEVPTVPGEINEFVVQLRPMSHLFKAGKQIKVEISSIDIPTDIETYDVMWHVCNATTTLHKIYRDGDHRSRVSLPVIPKSGNAHEAVLQNHASPGGGAGRIPPPVPSRSSNRAV